MICSLRILTRAEGSSCEMTKFIKTAKWAWWHQRSRSISKGLDPWFSLLAITDWGLLLLKLLKMELKVEFALALVDPVVPPGIPISWSEKSSSSESSSSMLIIPWSPIPAEAEAEFSAADLFPRLSKLLHVTSSGPPEVCKAKKEEEGDTQW